MLRWALLAAAVGMPLSSLAQTSPPPVGPLQLQALPGCLDSGGNHLNYNATTGQLTCGNTSVTNGTVTGGSVATANGFTGSVASSSSTLVITLGTPVNGLLKGNGTGIAAAAAGTDYLAPNGSGAALTGINAANITTGTLPYAQLPTATTSSAGAVAPNPISLSLAGAAVAAPVGGVRQPAGGDDSTVPFAVGSVWRDGAGRVYQSINAAAGYPMWQQVQSAVLPGDVIGLNVNTASYTSGGGSCVANEVLTFTGGMQITVTACTGGVPSTYSITQSRMHACMPATPTAISPLSTTGGDGSSVWNLGIVGPELMIGTRLLTRCYTTDKLINVVRSDTGEALDIGFLADGSLDTKTLDGFTSGGVPMAQYVEYSSGVNPRIATWYDQGPGGNNAAQSVAADRCTIFPGRQIGNSRTVMCDGRSDSSQWDPALTFLSLPAGVSVTGNNFTVVALAGVVTDNTGAPTSLLHIGAQGSLPLVFIYGSTGVGWQCQDSNSNKVSGLPIPDEGAVVLCDGSSSATTFSVGQATATGAAGISSSVSGGTIGEQWNAATSNPFDVAAMIVVPWSLTAAEQAAAQASIAATFQTTPEKRIGIVFIGDSHIDAWGYPYGQDVVRQTAALLNRPDVSMVNAAWSGVTLASFAGNPTTWTDVVVPELEEYAHSYLYIEGGYADLADGQTVAQVEATLQSITAAAHAVGASVRTICDTNVIRYNEGSSTLNPEVAALAAWILAGPSSSTGCDYVMDNLTNPAFDAINGPWPLPFFEQQDGGIHLTAADNGVRAQMLVNYLDSNVLNY